MDVQLKMEPTYRFCRPTYRIRIVYTHTTTYLLPLQVLQDGGVHSGGNTGRQGLWVAVAWLGFLVHGAWIHSGHPELKL